MTGCAGLEPTERPIRSVLVWRPSAFDEPHRAPGVLAPACCLRSTTAGTRAAVYRAAADQGVVGFFDFVSDAVPDHGGGWTAEGVLVRVDPFLPRAELLVEPDLAPVFTHIQGRRSLPEAAARRLAGLLPDLPFAARRD